MDPVALSFYAIICGLLGLVGPGLGAPMRRLIIGAGVGVVAASALPYLKMMLG